MNWIKAGLVTTAGFVMFVLPPVIAALVMDGDPSAGLVFDGVAAVWAWALAGVKMTIFPD